EKSPCLAKELSLPKTSAKNLIVIQDEEVKERFDSIFKNQPMMLKKGFNLESNDKMVVPLPTWNFFVMYDHYPMRS
ncbi:hypothetical protein J1N35_025826, partial [Gossypium stocksii]